MTNSLNVPSSAKILAVLNGLAVGRRTRSDLSVTAPVGSEATLQLYIAHSVSEGLATIVSGTGRRGSPFYYEITDLGRETLIRLATAAKKPQEEPQEEPQDWSIKRIQTEKGTLIRRGTTFEVGTGIRTPQPPRRSYTLQKFLSTAWG